MNDQDLVQSDRITLARILTAGSSDAGAWRPDELDAVLHFQLSAPLEADLGGQDPRQKDRLLAVLRAAGPSIRTFDDLLHHPQPPLELLEMVKEFAKQSCRQKGPLPHKVALALYYATIVVAWSRLEKRITELSDDMVRGGAQWVIDQPWVDQATRALMRAAIGAPEEPRTSADERR